MRKSRYEEIVRRFAGRRLIVVGDLMVDRYITGQVNRISPESPTMVVEVESDLRVPGGAANVVNNLSALGANVAIVGVIGADKEGEELRDDLARRGVDVSGIVIDASRPTTVKERILAQNRQLLRVDFEQTRPMDPPIIALLQAGVTASLDGAEAVLISDYNKGVLTHDMGAWLVETSRQQGRLLTVNPKPPTARRLRGADVLTINQAEAEGLAGEKFAEGPVMEAAGARLAAELDLGALIVTRGGKGLTLWKRARGAGGSVPEGDIEITRHVPAHRVEVYDVAGAGDTVISALTLALLCGADLVEAAILANHAAACVVRKVGVATVLTTELLADWSEGGDLV